MGCGLLSNTTKTTVPFLPKHPNHHPINVIKFHPTFSRSHKWPSFYCFPCSSPFKTRATSNNNFYKLLGISDGDTLDKIKKAYKQLVLKYHPDVSLPNMIEEHTKKFIEVHKAYQTLSNPAKRAVYDNYLAEGIDSNGEEFDEEREKKARWKSTWEAQLDALLERSMNRYRMRRQDKPESSST